MTVEQLQSHEERKERISIDSPVCVCVGGSFASLPPESKCSFSQLLRRCVILRSSSLLLRLKFESLPCSPSSFFLFLFFLFSLPQPHFSHFRFYFSTLTFIFSPVVLLYIVNLYTQSFQSYCSCPIYLFSELAQALHHLFYCKVFSCEIPYTSENFKDEISCSLERSLAGYPGSIRVSIFSIPSSFVVSFML